MTIIERGEKLAKLIQVTIEDQDNLKALTAIAERIYHSIKSARLVYAFGNGGSAAEADHFVAELLGAFSDRERPPMMAVSLSQQPSSLTAISNDYGYENYLTRCARAMWATDSLLLLTTSGCSKNIVEVVKLTMTDPGAYPMVMLITGQRYLSSELMGYRHDLFPVVVIPSMDTCEVQEVTLFLLHRVVALVEHFFKEPAEVNSGG